MDGGGIGIRRVLNGWTTKGRLLSSVRLGTLELRASSFELRAEPATRQPLGLSLFTVSGSRTGGLDIV